MLNFKVYRSGLDDVVSDFTRDFRRSVRDFGKWRTPQSCLINTLADGAECLHFSAI